MKGAILSVVSLGLVSSSVSCAPEEKPATYEKAKIDELLHSMSESEALGAMIVLTELREGRADRAHEALEFKIDCAVCTAWHVAETSPAERERALQFIESIKTYRMKYPRTKEARMGEDPFEELCDKKIAEARKILAELGEEPPSD